MRIFILEDDPNRREAFAHVLRDVRHVHIAVTAAEAKQLWSGQYDLVLLDHDLGGATYVPSEQEETGYSFVMWLIESGKVNDARNYMIHSWNSEGAKRMAAALTATGNYPLVIPFGKAALSVLERFAK